MAESVNIFEGVTGWPLQIFLDQEKIKKRGILFCARHGCKLILKDPHQLECGHRYCRDCLDIIRRGTPADHVCWPCFIEGENIDDTAVGGIYDEISGQSLVYDSEKLSKYQRCYGIDFKKTFKDNPATKELNRLAVVCPYLCDTQKLKLKDLEAHMTECLHRTMKCTQCGALIKYLLVTEHRKNECLERLVDCPNQGCTAGKMAAKCLQDHMMYNCVLKPALCTFCKTPVHGSMSDHYNTCQGPCPLQECPMAPGETMSTHISAQQGNIMKLLIGSMVELKDSTRQQTPHGDSINSLSGRVALVEGRTEDMGHLLLDELGKFSMSAHHILAAAAQAEKNRRAINKLTERCDTLTSDVEAVASQADSYRELERRALQQEEDVAERMARLDSDKQRMRSEEREQAERLDEMIVTSYDGHLIMRVENVIGKLQKAKSGQEVSFYSPPFYSGDYGYKMCLRIYPNGDGEGLGTHISVFFVVMRGEYDPLLKWPFNRKVTLALLNQTDRKLDITERFSPDPKSKSFAQPTTEKNMASGCPTMALQSDVYTDGKGYVVGDEMFIECSLGPEQDIPRSASVSSASSRPPEPMETK